MYMRLQPITHSQCHHARCFVPPSPGLMERLMRRYEDLLANKRLPAGTTFQQWFDYWVSSRRGESMAGLDDGRLESGPMAAGMALIDRPSKKLSGIVRTLVLLVDFPDKPHNAEHTASHFERMLFGLGSFAGGSMREYYQRISGFAPAGGGIDVQGAVHGWYRMPQPLSFYANDNSGTSDTFPRNAQGLARDAVLAAKSAGVDFTPYDSLGEHIVTALFVIHSGAGAEVSGDKGDIWSHKSVIPGNGVQVGPNLRATTYLTVPEDCKVGVCAHEWGHLAARWADYYDTGRVENLVSSGLGQYCLMASGSWGNGGSTPTLPNAMLRMFHGWITPTVITKTTKNLVLTPAAEGGSCIVIRNEARMTYEQYIIAEYRRRQFQDSFLPDEGLAIYVVDEAISNVNNESRLAIELLQADGRRDLAGVFGSGNQGDTGDLLPHGSMRTFGKAGKAPTNLPDGQWSGVTLTVKGKAGDPSLTLNVRVA